MTNSDSTTLSSASTRTRAWHRWLTGAAVAGVLLGSATSGAAQGRPIGFAERFALAEDRAAALDELVPGSTEHFYYRCLERQHAGALDDVERILADWRKSSNRSPSLIQQIELRQLLLRFPEAPDAVRTGLIKKLGLKFDHEQPRRGAAPSLPTRLDPAVLSPAALLREADRQYTDTVDGLRPHALWRLAGQKMGARERRKLLERLQTPDFENLPQLVLADLRRPGDFGNRRVHRHLTLAQLEECAQRRPELLQVPRFVTEWLKRLAPGLDVDLDHDRDAQRAYLDQVQSLVNRLGPVFNSLRAQVLYHRLRLDLETGQVDEDLLRNYLQLPRRLTYVAPRIYERARNQETVDLGASTELELSSPASDEELVRACLGHILADSDSFDTWSNYVVEPWLRRVFVEARVLAGRGDTGQLLRLVNDPSWVDELRNRVEIRFPIESRREQFAADEPVRLHVEVKNAPTVEVKVFEIDTFNYCSIRDENVDASIDLDGLIANDRKTLTFDRNPLQRQRRTLDLPQLRGTGVWIVELIGGGIASRTVVRKGGLQATQRLGAAGHVFKVHDLDGTHLKDAAVFFGKRRYDADKHGEIVIPYSTKAGNKTLLMQHRGLTVADRIFHYPEAYQLSASVVIDREELLEGRTASVLVRPSLQVNGSPIPPEVLEAAVLQIRAVDREGIVSNLDVRGEALKAAGGLTADHELVAEIRVPENLSHIEVTLTGRAQNLATGKPVNLSSNTTTVRVNNIDNLAATAGPVLGKTSAGYILDVLGKDGEPRPNEAITLTFELRDFQFGLQRSFRTDERGRVTLGALPGVTSVTMLNAPAAPGPWRLIESEAHLPQRLRAAAGEEVRIRYTGSETQPSRAALALFEVQPAGTDTTIRDAFSSLAIRDGFLVLSGLSPGRYKLLLRGTGQCLIDIVDGTRRDGWVRSPTRLVATENANVRNGGLQIRTIERSPDALSISLANAGPKTRVHVIATRYIPPTPLSALGAGSRGSMPTASSEPFAYSTYFEGRALGDEYRYILDRRRARKYPGNMLDRPGVLLNPWALETTTTGLPAGGGAGGRFGGRAGPAASAPGTASMRQQGEQFAHPGTYTNFGFLPKGSKLVSNLRPDAQGNVAIPLEALGDGQMIHVLAVRPGDEIYRVKAFDEVALQPTPRRLLRPFDPSTMLAEQRRIELVPAGGSAVIDDASTAEIGTLDSLAAVYQLFRSLTDNAELAEFEFLLRWPELSRSDRLELYSKYTCHELNAFLFFKDRAFFDDTVAPYLRNKVHRRFFDDWLLQNDLQPHLDPWRFNQRNTVEKVLLARRLGGDRKAAIDRLIRDIVSLRPQDPERDSRIFRSVLGSSALAESATLLAGLELQFTDGLNLRAADEARFAEQPGKTDLFRAVTRGREPTAKRLELADGAPQEDNEVREELDEKEQAFSSDAWDSAVGLGRRVASRRLYRAPDETSRYAETDYWHLPIGSDVAGRIVPNAFWRDFALHEPQSGPFLSSHVAEATGSFTEMLLALAVLDLPFKAGEQSTDVDGTQLTIRTDEPLLLVRQEVSSARAADESSVLVGQSFYRLDRRYKTVEGQQVDAWVTEEFETGVGYGCQVVVTNPTSTPRTIDLLLQVPEGAIAISGGLQTRTISMLLQRYSTQSIEYAFYFPTAGDFGHYPVHVASVRDGTVLGHADPVRFKVVDDPTIVDDTSWEYVAGEGSLEDVLGFLRTRNIASIDVDKAAWRMKNREGFDAILDAMRSRQMYSSTLWSYGLRHGDRRAMREYLAHAGEFLRGRGIVTLQTELVSLDPIERRWYQHIEYRPLLNPRAHEFGGRRKILNSDFANQYGAFTAALSQRPALDDVDWLGVAYYMLLQDRVSEAIDAFGKVDPAGLSDGRAKLQYDATSAYIAFYREDIATARRIATRHAQHPIAHWRKTFQQMVRHLDEIEGLRRPESTEPSGADLAASEPALEMQVESTRDRRTIQLAYNNLDRCDVRFFLMDVEFLFSTKPFVDQGSDAFAFVRPNLTSSIVLPKDAKRMDVAIPASLDGRNVLVEVRGAGLVRRQPVYANDLSVQWIENRGQLLVTDPSTDKALSKIYVKVFKRRPDGTVEFHKDGYTDLRGRFDYASLSGTGAMVAEKFAVLVLSEERGAVIREVTPPVR